MPSGVPEAVVRAAEVVLPCTELDETLAFYTQRLGFRVAAIFPADNPRVAVVAGHGLRVRLEKGRVGDPGVLRLLCDDPAAVAGGESHLTAPNGTRIELLAWETPLVVPEARPSFALTRMGKEAAWGAGRAGMLYRELVPDRQGGRFIASHIRIPEGGPVPDYVHFHRIRFQMIYCYKGWVRVVYEDQGPAFVLEAGDCVLQPPLIRHRVLESSAGLEVIEISCPAEHETLADLDQELPTNGLRPDRDFVGQRFIWHRANAATWSPARVPGFESRDLGIGRATDGLAAAHVARWRGSASPPLSTHDAAFLFHFVLAGEATLRREGHRAEPLGAGDAVVIPPGLKHAIAGSSHELELLQVGLPGGFVTQLHE